MLRYQLLLDQGEGAPKALDVRRAGVSHVTARGKRVGLSAKTSLDPLAILEEVRIAGRQALLMMVPEARDFRLNASPAPLLTELHLGDELRIGADTILAVSALAAPSLLFPSGDLVGRDCAVCRTPVTEESRCYVCDRCGAVMHAEATDAYDGEPLECWQIVDVCAACSEPVIRTEGRINAHRA
ncbi:MAG: DC1 domain-containing protein [Planctomycetota bacterium]